MQVTCGRREINDPESQDGRGVAAPGAIANRRTGNNIEISR